MFKPLTLVVSMSLFFAAAASADSVSGSFKAAADQYGDAVEFQPAHVFAARMPGDSPGDLIGSADRTCVFLTAEPIDSAQLSKTDPCISAANKIGRRSMRFWLDSKAKLSFASIDVDYSNYGELAKLSAVCEVFDETQISCTVKTTGTVKKAERGEWSLNVSFDANVIARKKLELPKAESP